MRWRRLCRLDSGFSPVSGVECSSWAVLQRVYHASLKDLLRVTRAATAPCRQTAAVLQAGRQDTGLGDARLSYHGFVSGLLSLSASLPCPYACFPHFCFFARRPHTHLHARQRDEAGGKGKSMALFSILVTPNF